MQERDVGATEITRDPLLVDGLIVGKTASGRSLFSASGKAAIVRLFKDAIASASRIAFVNGINVNLVFKWARSSNVHHKPKRRFAITKPELIAVQVNRESAHTVEQSIQIELPKGIIRLTLARVQDLSLVIDQLSNSR